MITPLGYTPTFIILKIKKRGSDTHLFINKISGKWSVRGSEVNSYEELKETTNLTSEDINWLVLKTGPMKNERKQPNS